MKIQEAGHRVDSNGVESTGSFSIKTSAHAFQMLSSGLYTNKILAVVRELSCNAADAHVDAGRLDVAFEVKVPNKLDSQFYVKDFGKGLSEQQVFKLYTTYFESTKNASNAFTGGFGLGSKSPFAYTDSFTVESRQDGVKSIYTAFVGEDNVPQIAKLTSMETSEADGLTVGFPVKPDDFAKFAEEVSNVIHWFSSPVNVIGVSNGSVPRFDDASLRTLAYRTDTYAIEGEAWSPLKHTSQRMAYGNSLLRRKHKLPSDQIGTVVMGNVHYPLAAQSEWSGDPVVAWWTAVQPFLFVPIGMFSVAVSREALAYDKTTLKHARTFLHEAFGEFARSTAGDLVKVIHKLKGLEQYQKARMYLTSLGVDNAAVTDVYLDAINADEALRKAVAVRHVLPFTPKTFDLVKMSHMNVNSLGSPHLWQANQLTAQSDEISPFNQYAIVENANGIFGADVDKSFSKFQSLKFPMYHHCTRFMVVPHRGKAITAEYQDELKTWKETTGFDVAVFNGADAASNAKTRIPAGRYMGWHRTEDALLTEDTPAFFWTTKAVWEKISPKFDRNVEGFCKTLGLPQLVKNLYVVADSDVEAVSKLPHQQPFIETFTALLNNPKTIKKIERIKPMLSGSSSSFTRMRARYRNEPDWQTEMASTKIGTWIEKMRYTKGPASFDYATTKILAAFKSVLGDQMIAPIPEYYDGAKIESTFAEAYPLLRMHLNEKKAVAIDMIKHMQSYVTWREAQGAAPPQQQMEFDDVNP